MKSPWEKYVIMKIVWRAEAMNIINSVHINKRGKGREEKRREEKKRKMKKRKKKEKKRKEMKRKEKKRREYEMERRKEIR